MTRHQERMLIYVWAWERLRVLYSLFSSIIFIVAFSTTFILFYISKNKKNNNWSVCISSLAGWTVVKVVFVLSLTKGYGLSEVVKVKEAETNDKRWEGKDSFFILVSCPNVFYHFRWEKMEWFPPIWLSQNLILSQFHSCQTFSNWFILSNSFQSYTPNVV